MRLNNGDLGVEDIVVYFSYLNQVIDIYVQLSLMIRRSIFSDISIIS